MTDNDFNPARIRKYSIVTIDGEQRVQFIAIGDKHKMIRQDDGSVKVEKLPEQGREYNYHAPFSIADALSILSQEAHENHASLSEQLKTKI